MRQVALILGMRQEGVPQQLRRAQPPGRVFVQALRHKVVHGLPGTCSSARVWTLHPHACECPRLCKVTVPLPAEVCLAALLKDATHIIASQTGHPAELTPLHARLHSI